MHVVQSILYQTFSLTMQSSLKLFPPGSIQFLILRADIHKALARRTDLGPEASVFIKVCLGSASDR